MYVPICLKFACRGWLMQSSCSHGELYRQDIFEYFVSTTCRGVMEAQRAGSKVLRIKIYLAVVGWAAADSSVTTKLSKIGA